jgi:hypothetical protein
MKILRELSVSTIALLLASSAAMSGAQEIRSGIWVGTRTDALPLPASGYQVYLTGELHGLEQNEDFQLEYLAELNKRSDLRDVAIEEKGVYEEQAQAFISGKSDDLPVMLCLRKGLLLGIRQLNSSLRDDRRIRIHLIDVDSPAAAIQEHLLAIKARIPEASDVNIPGVDRVKERGLDAVHRLEQFRIDSHTRSELRTIEHSIRAYQQGLEVGIGPPKGSPYLEDREQALAENILI